MLNLDQRKAKLSTAVKWSLGLLAAVIISPIIFLAIKGLVGLAIAAIVGMGIINFAPVLSMKFANWKLKALKDEARENPIETRQNQALAARARIQAAQKELTIFSAEVKNMSDEIRELHKTEPDDAADMEKQFITVEKNYNRKAQSLTAAIAQVEQFEKATARAAKKWKMAQSMLRINKMMGATADAEMDKILASEALDSVSSAMNLAMAEMETTLYNPDPPSIAHQPSQVIDIPVLQEVKVAR